MSDKKQLHKICDRIWILESRAREVIGKLKENNPVQAYQITVELEKELGAILTELREKALREEGKHVVVNETYQGRNRK